MSEEQGTPTEHVSMGDNGVIMLSEEAQAVMEGIEAPQLDEPIQEATPAIAEPPKVEAKKIKHNGVEVEVAPDREIELLRRDMTTTSRSSRLKQREPSCKRTVDWLVLLRHPLRLKLKCHRLWAIRQHNLL